MRTELRRVQEKKDEKITIECVEVTSEIREIITYLQTKGKEISGVSEGHYANLKLSEIYYFEAIDEHVFAYTKDKVYEIKSRLYEVEERFREIFFLRISKSMVVNLRKIETITPALNARFMAHLKNGEQLIVTRQYVKPLKEILLGGQKK